ncbi:metallophosphoesterase, partial [Singulisphaera rosea]
MLCAFRTWTFLCLLFSLGACPALVVAEEIEFNLLQINDVYEIARSLGDRLGGLSRVATIRKELVKDNPNTFTVLAGDALSPSAMGTASYEGDELAGRQMVAVLNTMGLDFATFGNHELDLKKDQLLARVRESSFTWISSNVTDATANPFPGVPRNRVLRIEGKHGGVVRVGLIGLTIDSTKADYARYDSPYRACLEQIDALKGHCDILVAITHLDLEQDKQLAAAFPELHLILGGHEHDRQYAFEERVPYRAPVAKADFNVHSVFVHRLRFDTVTRRLEIVSKLRAVDESIKDDSRTLNVANYWRKLAFAGLKEALGQDPEAQIGSTQVKLDGREAAVRSGSTNLTRLIVAAVQSASPG